MKLYQIKWNIGVLNLILLKLRLFFFFFPVLVALMKPFWAPKFVIFSRYIIWANESI